MSLIFMGNMGSLLPKFLRNVSWKLQKILGSSIYILLSSKVDNQNFLRKCFWATSCPLFSRHASEFPYSIVQYTRHLFIFFTENDRRLLNGQNEVLLHLKIWFCQISFSIAAFILIDCCSHNILYLPDFYLQEEIP